MGPGSADYLHLLVEAKKLAFADRAKFYADPDFNRLPVEELISKEYAATAAEANRHAAGGRQCARRRSRNCSSGDTIYL